MYQLHNIQWVCIGLEYHVHLNILYELRTLDNDINAHLSFHKVFQKINIPLRQDAWRFWFTTESKLCLVNLLVISNGESIKLKHVDLVNIRKYRMYAFYLLDMNLECGHALTLYWFTGIFFEERHFP